MDTTALAHDAGRRTQLVDELLALVHEAAGRSWTATAKFDRAVTRWSRHAETPLDVLVLVAEVRRGKRPLSRAQNAALEHLSLVAVAAVSERMVSAALTDPLTGLATRARLEDEVQHLLASSLRNGSPLTAVVLDIDGLKQINDTQGHAAGDAAIAELGRAIRTSLRKVDHAFRLGGDEFVLFMPDTTDQGARTVVERIQQHCTTPFSVGIATHSGAHWDTDVAGWMQRADAAMYEQRQQLRAMLVPAGVRSGKARAAGLVLAAGLSVGAWGGIAMAVHGAMGGSAPAGPATSDEAMDSVPVSTDTSTVALPRTVDPAVVTAGPAVHTVTQAVDVPRSTPDTSKPAVATPVIDVPPLPVEVPVIEPPADPGTSNPGLLTGLLHTVRSLLGRVL